MSGVSFSRPLSILLTGSVLMLLVFNVFSLYKSGVQNQVTFAVRESSDTNSRKTVEGSTSQKMNCGVFVCGSSGVPKSLQVKLRYEGLFHKFEHIGIHYSSI